MSERKQIVYLARHGATAWSVSGQHTGKTDLPLLPEGEAAAKELGERLRGIKPAAVFTSPLLRAKRTCEFAGFGGGAVVDPDLVEWDYGSYEGRTSAEIRRERPDWDLFRDGGPAGESVAQVAARADRFVARARAVGGDVLAFSSGHILRMIAARWLGKTEMAACLTLSTASVSALGYEHERPVIRLWNWVGKVEG